MTQMGQIALVIAFLISVFSAAAVLIGARRGLPELMTSGRRGVVAVWVLTTLASAALWYAFITHDFQVKYVYQYSSRDLSLIYLISAFWAGQEGSLLLWAFVLSIFGAIVVYQTRKRNADLAPYVLLVITAIEVFFLGILNFSSQPFARLDGIPPEGNGLNPMLANPGMFFHPTTLYLGYVGFTVPFAFCIAALVTGRLGDQWIKSTRRWTLFAWLFLTLGNLFGAWWAYNELGWGGYWGWDPVESASFMPWLVGTAYLHSVMIQQRRGMLKVWNIGLIVTTFALSIFGTFLTRSGVLSSVHSFGQSNLGPLFVGLIVVVVVGALGLIWHRLPNLKSENQLDSLVSRESSFLFNNVILVGAAFAVFLGTVFPLISEAVRGVKVTVGPPFFNTVTAPIFLVLIALMGVCPLIGWRRASRDNLLRNFLYPFAIAVFAVALLAVLGIREAPVLLGMGLTAFVLFTILLEIFRGIRARHRTSGKDYLSAAGSLVWGNKPRYGGYIVHLGVIILAIGIIASQAYQVEKEVTLMPGESAQIKDFTLTYRGLDAYPTKTREVVTATLDVYDGSNRKLTVLTPGKTFQASTENPVSEVSVRTTLAGDLYTILEGWEDQKAAFKFLINPLVLWIWLGGIVLIVGAIVAFWPDAREAKRDAARLAEATVAVEEGANES
ncbi:MAG: heme lyase CcmF/NrfE family subunit [Chloroflexi bacterium]|nr:heme lyase CcmF/NrfE family subunit [Chloroflexota bacterium]